MYLLDTNALTTYYYNPADMESRLSRFPKEERFVSAINVWEIMHGCNKSVELERAKSFSGKPHQLSAALSDLCNNLQFLSRLPVVPYNETAEDI